MPSAAKDEEQPLLQNRTTCSPDELSQITGDNLDLSPSTDSVQTAVYHVSGLGGSYGSTAETGVLPFRRQTGGHIEVSQREGRPGISRTQATGLTVSIPSPLHGPHGEYTEGDTTPINSSVTPYPDDTSSTQPEVSARHLSNHGRNHGAISYQPDQHYVLWHGNEIRHYDLPSRPFRSVTPMPGAERPLPENLMVHLVFNLLLAALCVVIMMYVWLFTLRTPAKGPHGRESG
ncbi:hypothetical protein VTK73DRAFT_3547 [Phialemonium thermophilum]|uniref:Uncharacterized protein n=1 Tax=Phialemonium thermophilum TaxID=223376 RepID=A0ABR3XZM6_9PEZI